MLTYIQACRSRVRPAAPLGLVALFVGLAGCEVDSFFDPSRTGRFEQTATSLPILERLDVIEEDAGDLWGETSDVTPEDLMPSDLSYELAPGDVLSVQIYGLFDPDNWHVSTGAVDASGSYRVPEIGDVRAAGLTAQEFQDRLIALLEQRVMEEPLVNVIVESSRGFRFTVYGAIASPGMYQLQRSDLRLLDALAMAGGLPLTTERIYLIRQVELSDEMRPSWERDRMPSAPAEEGGAPPEVDIESLIENLGDRPAPPPGAAPPTEGEAPTPPRVDVDATRPPRPSGADGSFIFDEQRGEWVRVRRPATGAADEGSALPPSMLAERVIEVPFQRLKRGDNSYNIVIRPSDRIYVQEPPQGVIYIDGEIARRGVYNLPATGGRLTLSRLVAAAGGLGPLAVPERVDLTRVVGEGDREATVRLDLRAIRNRTEPDVVLRADDQIIIGTDFWATPLAVLRNGFRVTYGFGFLLDRNFGNDVFGAPPVNRVDE